MTTYIKAPRVLRLTFEFHIPQGMGVNIRNTKRFEAVNVITAAVQAVVGRAFPWADRMRVRHEWMYAWWDETAEVELPPTPVNTRSDHAGEPC
ncbi:hypothetical protein ACFWRV_01730 [Streptomyces sp. NPDC058576]|uniref:hypothetical protein n=1 Tax=Streptomyces sp. NPDC058576 TaxID=3346547 RepID=UPI00364AD6F2